MLLARASVYLSLKQVLTTLCTTRSVLIFPPSITVSTYILGTQSLGFVQVEYKHVPS